MIRFKLKVSKSALRILLPLHSAPTISISQEALCRCMYIRGMRKCGSTPSHSRNLQVSRSGVKERRADDYHHPDELNAHLSGHSICSSFLPSLYPPIATPLTRHFLSCLVQVMSVCTTATENKGNPSHVLTEMKRIIPRNTSSSVRDRSPPRQHISQGNNGVQDRYVLN